MRSESERTGWSDMASSAAVFMLLPMTPWLDRLPVEVTGFLAFVFAGMLAGDFGIRATPWNVAVRVAIGVVAVAFAVAAIF
jgi:uncharacterized membrane protein YjjP (DUF1212 family)